MDSNQKYDSRVNEFFVEGYKMKKAILFVDDERQILKSINRLFMDTEPAL